MSTHEQVDQLLAGFALGALSEGDAALVRRHLAECETCAENLGAMADVVGALPLSVEPLAPPAGLGARIDAIPRRRHGVLPFLPRPARPVLRLPFAARPAIRYSWAAAAIAAVALVSWNVALQRQLDDTRSRVAQLGAQVRTGNLTNAGGVRTGAVSYLANQHLALVSLRGLATPAGTQEYELWVIPSGGAPIPAGAFLPEADGTKLLVVQSALRPGDTLAVTAEPRGVAHTAPTTKPFIAGEI